MRSPAERPCPCGSRVYGYGDFTITRADETLDEFYWRECRRCGAITYHNADTHTQVTREEVLP